jgi:hypothetical protein
MHPVCPRSLHTRHLLCKVCKVGGQYGRRNNGLQATAAPRLLLLWLLLGLLLRLLLWLLLVVMVVAAVCVGPLQGVAHSFE